jgi:hypothetical protein
MEGEKRAFGRNQSIRDQAVKMGCEPDGVIAEVMQGPDHAGDPTAVRNGFLKKLLD